MQYGASAGQADYGVFFVVSMCLNAPSASGEDSFNKLNTETQSISSEKPRKTSKTKPCGQIADAIGRV